MDFLWASVEEIVPGGGGKEPIFAERELRVDPGRCAWHNNNLDLRMQTLPGTERKQRYMSGFSGARLFIWDKVCEGGGVHSEQVLLDSFKCLKITVQVVLISVHLSL